MYLQNSHCRNDLNLQTTDITGAYSIRLRSDTEAFIHRCFSKAYGADISQFMPILLCLKDQLRSPRAALGLRPALNNKLFLENYLEQPIEQVLSGKVHEPVSRSEIIEVGNLAIGDKGDARALIIAMTAFLSDSQYKWACFTIPPVLINSFKRLGLPLTELEFAHIDRLPQQEQKAWGSYYEQSPRVMAGCISGASKLLLRYSLQEQAMLALWQQARRSGNEAA